MRAAIPALLLFLAAPLQLGCSAKHPSGMRSDFAPPTTVSKASPAAKSAAAAKRDPFQKLRQALNAASRKGQPASGEQGSVGTTGAIVTPPVAQSGIGAAGWWSVTSVPSAATVPVATGGVTAPQAPYPSPRSNRPRNVLIGSALLGGIVLLYFAIRRHDQA